LCVLLRHHAALPAPVATASHRLVTVVHGSIVFRLNLENVKMFNVRVALKRYVLGRIIRMPVHEFLTHADPKLSTTDGGWPSVDVSEASSRRLELRYGNSVGRVQPVAVG